MTVYNFYNPNLHSNIVRGTLTSVTDFYYHISKVIKCNIQNCTTDYNGMLKLSNKNNNFGLNGYKLSKLECADDIVVMSSRVLIDSVKFQDIKIECKTLVLLDSHDILLGNLGISGNIGLILQNNPNVKFDNIILLANPSTKNIIFKNYEYIEYYHKFNINRIQNLYSSTIYEYKRSNKEYIKTYNYYTENIGKNLIERLILNIPVEYSPEGKGIDDGLHYYLKYLGVDDNLEQPLENIDCSKLLLEDIKIIDMLKGL